jgi:hypothetical protein
MTSSDGTAFHAPLSDARLEGENSARPSQTEDQWPELPGFLDRRKPKLAFSSQKKPWRKPQIVSDEPRDFAEFPPGTEVAA